MCWRTARACSMRTIIRNTVMRVAMASNTRITNSTIRITITLITMDTDMTTGTTIHMPRIEWNHARS